MSRARGRHPSRTPNTARGETPELERLTPEQIAEFGKEPERNIPGDDTHLVNYTTKRQAVPVPDKLAEFRGQDAHGVPVSPETHYDRPDIPGSGNHRARVPHEERPPVKPVPIPVYVVEEGAGGKPLRTMGTTHFTVPATGSEPIRFAARDKDRISIGILVETATATLAETPPSVPATGVAAQNPYPYPVQVVIAANGATITNVSVNGVTAGTAAGTYYVPAYGSISVAYTVATPTWTWTGQNVPVAGVRISHEVSDLDVGHGALLPGGSSRYNWFDCEDELFAVSADANTPAISVVYLYEVPEAGP